MYLVSEMALQDVIKSSREKLGLKQDEIAKLIGVTTQTYGKWETGKTEPKASQVVKLSAVLKVSINEICSGEMYTNLELVEFIRMKSKYSVGVSEFDLDLALWESLPEPIKYIESLKLYSI